VAQQVAVAETAMAVLGEGRVIRHPVRQIEAAKPTIGEVQMHLFAKPPLGADSQAIPHQQHADQQLGINRWAACIAVERSQMMPHTVQIDEAVDGTQ
jgi:hypothetical protein